MSTTPNFDDEPVSPRHYDLVVFDGGYLIHTLSGKAIRGETFEKYCEKVFLPKILHELDFTSRADIVWDRYLPMSIKGSTREKRGPSVGNTSQAQPKCLWIVKVV